jgi:putative DNA primase/helicase
MAIKSRCEPPTSSEACTRWASAFSGWRGSSVLAAPSCIVVANSRCFTVSFRVLQMTRSFLGREDQGLIGRLLGELPSILKWSLEGLDRLRSRGYLTQPKSAADAVEQLQTLGSPTKAFVSERCKIAPGGSVAVGDLFNAWLTWNQLNNRENPGTLQIFARNLLAAFPQIKKSQPRDGDKRVRMYEGITLLPLENDIAA